MGIPKFYRWMSERYPCLSEVVQESEVPPFDALYLDMNGIVHNCTHGDPNDDAFQLTEEQMFRDIGDYIATLFRIIKPRRVFYMAVDGVAPRAKMNQQRARRFRAAKDAEEAAKKAAREGKVSSGGRFDSNCITPGTEFMARLNDYLKYFVHFNISTNPDWQNIRVILSGHDVPGEGEHKIMDFIRSEKSRDDYDVTTRHCMYGLDADLMVLGLASHEPYFSLLREEVKFGRQKREANVAKINFHLLSLTLFREYIALEFDDLKNKIKFSYDFEQLIDDWILMGFFVGNDFLPNLPHFHMGENALEILWDAYRKVLPKLDGYIQQGGIINMSRLQVYLHELGKQDRINCADMGMNIQYLESKTGRKQGTNKPPKALPSNVPKPLPTPGTDFSFEERDEFGNVIDEDDNDGTSESELLQWKHAYYLDKLGIDTWNNDNQNLPQTLGKEYVIGLQWVLLYYYHGVPSWSWFFPSHYAPLVSDIVNIADFVPQFNLGQPFRPFEQLLSVLPAASGALLPETYRRLMTDVNSPIISFYPTDFRTDINGKKAEWEAIVLVPFIDQDLLLAAIKPCEKDLSSSEQFRNGRTVSREYHYNADVTSIFKAPLPGFADIVPAPVSFIELTCPHCKPGRQHKALCDGVDLSHRQLGFPSLSGLKFTHVLKEASVVVFDMPSRSKNTILQLAAPENIPHPLSKLAKALIGTTCYGHWPRVKSGLIVAVSTEQELFSMAHDPQQPPVLYRHTATDCANWKQLATSAFERSLTRYGIDLGEVRVLVHVQPKVGLKYQFKDDNSTATAITLWSSEEECWPLQAILRDVHLVSAESIAAVPLQQLFPVGAMACLLAPTYYGAIGHVKGVTAQNRVDLSIVRQPLANTAPIVANNRDELFHPAEALASVVGVSPTVVGKLTGRVDLFPGSPFKTDRRATAMQIGFDMKNKSRSEELCGFSKAVKVGNNIFWNYSQATAKQLEEYKREFPGVIAAIEADPSANCYFSEAVFGAARAYAETKRLMEWIDTVPNKGASFIPWNSQILAQPTIKMLEKLSQIPRNNREVEVQDIAPAQVLVLSSSIDVAPDPTVEFRLGDYVVVVRAGVAVPPGAHGIIVGVLQGLVFELDVLFDDPFPSGTNLGGRCSPNRGYRVPPQWLVNLSHGRRQSKGSSSSVVSAATPLPDAGQQILQKLKAAPVQAQSTAASVAPSPAAVTITPAAVVFTPAPAPQIAPAQFLQQLLAKQLPVVQEQGSPVPASVNSTPAVSEPPTSASISASISASVSASVPHSVLHDPLPPMGPIEHSLESVTCHDPDEFANFWHELESAQREKDIEAFGSDLIHPQVQHGGGRGGYKPHTGTGYNPQHSGQHGHTPQGPHATHTQPPHSGRGGGSRGRGHFHK